MQSYKIFILLYDLLQTHISVAVFPDPRIRLHELKMGSDPWKSSVVLAIEMAQKKNVSFFLRAPAIPLKAGSWEKYLLSV